jgi:hypothetical protein
MQGVCNLGLGQFLLCLARACLKHAGDDRLELSFQEGREGASFE